MKEDLFNPYENLSVYHDQEGNPIFENLEDNGKPVSMLGEDGKYHSVLIPKRYLNANAYRKWFKSCYPNGCIDVEDLTLPAVFNGTVFAESTEFKVKVTLYEDREKKKQISNSYGIIKKQFKQDARTSMIVPEFEDCKNTFELAQSIALRNAMLNAGFLFDANASALKEKDAHYQSIINLGPVVSTVQVSAISPALPAEEKVQEKPDILSYLNSMQEELAKPELTEKQSESAKVAEKTAEDAAKEVIFTCLDGASSSLKALEGRKVGDLEEYLLAYFSGGNFEGKLTKETIDAITTLA